MNYQENSRGQMLFQPYMLGFDYMSKVDCENYRRYMTIVGITRELLNDCSIRVTCKGYIYIQDCVIAIIDQRNINLRLKSDVYPYVAFKYGVKDVSNVEHSIRNAICSAYRHNENDHMHGSMLMNRFESRPTNKEFLFSLTQEVCRRLWSESVEFNAY